MTSAEVVERHRAAGMERQSRHNRKSPRQSRHDKSTVALTPDTKRVATESYDVLTGGRRRQKGRRLRTRGRGFPRIPGDPRARSVASCVSCVVSPPGWQERLCHQLRPQQRLARLAVRRGCGRRACAQEPAHGAHGHRPVRGGGEPAAPAARPARTSARTAAGSSSASRTNDSASCSSSRRGSVESSTDMGSRPSSVRLSRRGARSAAPPHTTHLSSTTLKEGQHESEIPLVIAGLAVGLLSGCPARPAGRLRACERAVERRERAPAPGPGHESGRDAVGELPEPASYVRVPC